jgi:hypothetical protein
MKPDWNFFIGSPYPKIKITTAAVLDIRKKLK